MGLIFWFSSQPEGALPAFGWADKIVKKSSHIIGYALLAFWYWFAFGMDYKRRWLVWLLAMLYAVTDEYHQSFVPGRNATLWDVLVFDNIGVLISLWWANKFIIQKRPGITRSLQRWFTTDH